ncbi:hypothetical protein [uncultured Megamonas sp.]|uniref:hypothetical protein n=1 Tax=uncultured Megamonas sp. TaxID=286140 RepID=UPI0025998CE6|nr:hypothetical protein [uncultured Megamonas sp.]
MLLDYKYDAFAKIRKKALKLSQNKDKNIYLSDADILQFKKAIKNSLDNIVIEYKKNATAISFLTIFEEEYYLNLKLLVETKIKEVREIKNQIEDDVREYVQGTVDKFLSDTRKNNLIIKIVEKLIILEEEYDFFAKQRLGVLKFLNYYNKKLTFYEAEADGYVSLVKEILNSKEKEYEDTGEIYSFIIEFRKRYFNKMREAVLNLLDEENVQYKMRKSFVKKEIRILYKDLFKKDKIFLQKVIKQLNDKKSFNYHTIKYFFIKNILLYIELPFEDEKVNNNVYDYISKEEIQKGTSEQDIRYLIKTKSKEDLGELKKNISNILNRLYSVDCGGDNNKYIYKAMKNKNALEAQLKNMKGIDINKLKDIEWQMSEIETCLYKMQKVFEENLIVNIFEMNEDGKEYSILEHRALRQPSFENAKAKFFSYTDIYETIKDKLSESSRIFFKYMFGYIVLEFKRRGHEDVELYDYVKDDAEFIAFYNKNIPDIENPNYIENATDKKYDLPNEKIVHKAIAFITDYLNIKYDTGRKRRKEILKDVYATVKEENTGLRYFRRFLEEDL